MTVGIVAPLEVGVGSRTQAIVIRLFANDPLYPRNSYSTKGCMPFSGFLGEGDIPKKAGQKKAGQTGSGTYAQRVGGERSIELR